MEFGPLIPEGSQILARVADLGTVRPPKTEYAERVPDTLIAYNERMVSCYAPSRRLTSR